jgi:hypothetical protein
VAAARFVNGLPIFYNYDYYSFNAGVFDTSYIGYTGLLPASDTTGHQSLPDLRNAFLAHVAESYQGGGLPNTKPHFFSATDFYEVCLTATLGYYDAAGVPGGNLLNFGQALTKVWLVSSEKGGLPVVLVRDDDGAARGLVFDVP